MLPDVARFIKVSKVLKHIEMLDVAIMGIIVVTCAGTAYHKQGRSWVQCVEPIWAERTSKDHSSRIPHTHILYIYIYIIKGSLGGETSVLRTFRMSGKELVKELAKKELVKETVSQRKS